MPTATTKPGSSAFDWIHRVVTLVLAVATAVSGVLLNSANHQLEALNAESQRDKVFSEDLFGQIDRLSRHSVQSKMAFAGLWVLAHDPETQTGLVAIASVSDDDALKEVAKNLTQQGYSVGDLEASPQLSTARAALIDQLSSSKSTSAVTTDQKANGATADLLANLTPSSISGFVYLGTVGTDPAKLNGGGTITSTSVPKVDSIIVPASNLHLRSDPPTSTGLGQIVGVVDSSDKLKVQSIKRYPLSGAKQSVWADVTIESSPQPLSTSSPGAQ